MSSTRLGVGYSRYPKLNVVRREGRLMTKKQKLETRFIDSYTETKQQTPKTTDYSTTWAVRNFSTG